MKVTPEIRRVLEAFKASAEPVVPRAIGMNALQLEMLLDEGLIEVHRPIPAMGKASYKLTEEGTIFVDRLYILIPAPPQYDCMHCPPYTPPVDAPARAGAMAHKAIASHGACVSTKK